MSDAVSRLVEDGRLVRHQLADGSIVFCCATPPKGSRLFPCRKDSDMPSTLTYPGVYIEEVPSGVRDDHGRSHLDHRFHRGDDRRGPLTSR